MERKKQVEMVRAICTDIAEEIVAGANSWPSHWDGHELRDLVAERFGYIRTTVMKTDKVRRRRFLRDNRNRYNSTP